MPVSIFGSFFQVRQEGGGEPDGRTWYNGASHAPNRFNTVPVPRFYHLMQICLALMITYRLLLFTVMFLTSYLAMFLQFIFLALAVSVIFNVVRGFSNNSSNKSSGEKKDDGWGDL